MRTTLPAALLLLLSWFLPASAHAQVASHVVAVHARVQEQPGLQREPYRETVGQARYGLLGTAPPAGPAVLPSVLSQPRRGWVAVVASPAADVPADRRPAAAPARGPPSTEC
ncbi:hypothetical protein AB0L65_26255 [Nonomuraea sp. NPDC052116]|uniref:hypothetical protein n=1 Tax=Nonomuraea sp. NPDC052116 TaxID=3155665 RepID=UPI003442C40A